MLKELDCLHIFILPGMKEIYIDYVCNIFVK